MFFRLVASIAEDALVLETSDDGLFFVELSRIDGLPDHLMLASPGFGAFRDGAGPADEVGFGRATLTDEECDSRSRGAKHTATSLRTNAARSADGRARARP